MTSDHRTCGVDADLQVIDGPLRDEVARTVAYAFNEPHRIEVTRLAMMLRQIEKRIHSAPEAYIDECPFDGYVDLHDEVGVLVWTCPVCGHEHREEPEQADTIAEKFGEA